MSEYCSQSPSTYAQNKLSTMLSRWSGPIGDAVRRLSSSSNPLLFPAAPPTMCLAFSANSMGMTEIVPATEDKRFIELGLYNLPASTGTGTYSGPQPNSQYGRLASSQRAIDLIGRRASFSDWQTDYEGQVAVGLLGYRDDGLNNVESRIPASVRPRERGSSWDVTLAIAGYVLSTGMVSAINRHATLLAAVPEHRRAAALFSLVAADFQRAYASGRVPDASERRVFLRVVQRIEVGRVLQARTGGSTGWWPDYGADRDAIFHWFTLALRGEPSGDCQPPGNRSVSSVSPDTLAGSIASAPGALEIAMKLVLAAAVAFGVFKLWERFRRQ